MRCFLGIMISVLITLASSPATAQLHIRKDVDDLTAAEVQSLRRGIAQMVQWNSAPRGSPDYRRSWAYWANMHAHFGDDCVGPPPTGRPGMAGQGAIEAKSPDEVSTWCRCVHGETAFLTWHRMYVFYFERVLQAAAKDPSLRVPYWDFARTRQLPAIVREITYDDSGQTRLNPLFSGLRRAALNTETGRLVATVVDVTPAFRAHDFEAFSMALEDQPHGNVHCAVGAAGCGTGLMGHPATAAQDPVFWLHHINIDRLFDCWMRKSAARQPSGGDVLDRVYSFPDENGVIQSRRVREMLTSAQLGIRYANGARCPASPAAGGGQFLSVAADRTFAIGGPATIGRGTATVPVTLPAAARAALRRGPFLSSRPRRSTLVIKGLRFDATPGALIEIRLVTAGGKQTPVGILNFFARAAAVGETSGAGGHAHAAPGFEIRLNATAAFDQIAREDSLGQQASVAFAPVSGVEGEDQATATALIPADSNIRYDAIEIVVKDQ